MRCRWDLSSTAPGNTWWQPTKQSYILRRRLLESVRRVEGGGDPIGVSIADYTQLRALVDTVIDRTTRWQDVTPSRLDAKRAELSPA